MRNQDIELAITNAELFLHRAKRLLAETSKTYKVGEYEFHHSAPKLSGAVRRQSMELTRALADMRRTKK